MVFGADECKAWLYPLCPLPRRGLVTSRLPLPMIYDQYTLGMTFAEANWSAPRDQLFRGMLNSKKPAQNAVRAAEPQAGRSPDSAYRELEELIRDNAIAPGTVLSEQRFRFALKSAAPDP